MTVPGYLNDHDVSLKSDIAGEGKMVDIQKSNIFNIKREANPSQFP
jgi:hypothetical protein